MRDIKVQMPSGTYTGLNNEGEIVKLTIEQLEHGFTGQGTVNGNPIAISGINIWAATGTITFSDGSSSLVRLKLTPGNEALTIKSSGQQEIILNSNGTSVELPSGPFTGIYRPAEGNSSLVEATIIQIGSLIVGNAEIIDQAAAITGNVVAPNKAVGLITYIDESQVSFEAELSTDSKRITFLGMGEPIVLEKF
jgi:hypothetical protein